MELLARLPQTDLAAARRRRAGDGHAGRLAAEPIRARSGRSRRSSIRRPARARRASPIPYNRDLRPGGFASAQIRAGAIDRAAAARIGGADRRCAAITSDRRTEQQGSAPRRPDRHGHRPGRRRSPRASTATSGSSNRPAPSSIPASRSGRSARAPRAERDATGVDEPCATSRPGRSATRSSRSSCSRACWRWACSRFMRMDVNNNPDISFPAAIVVDQPARRGADRARDPGHPARRGGGARHQRRRRDQLDDPRRQQRDLRPVRHRHPDRPRRQRRPRRHRPHPRRPARRHPRAAGPARSTIDDEPIGYHLGRKHGDDARAAELVSSTTRVDRRLLRRRGRRRSSAAPAASAARSGSSSIRRGCRPRASPPPRSTSSCAQININAAGGRAEIAGSEQSVRVLGNALTAYALGETQISLGGGRTVRLNAIASVRDQYAEQRSYGIQNGRQVVSFMVQKAKGYSDVTVYHAVHEAAGRARSARIRGSASPLLFTPVEYIEMQYDSRRCGRWSKARCSPSSSSSCSCATGARP